MKLTKRGEKKKWLYSTERSDGESPSLGDSSVIHLSYSSLNALNMCSGLVHWEDPEGWDGKGGGMGDQDGETHVNPWLIQVSVWQKPLQYCKVISLQLITINEK